MGLVGLQRKRRPRCPGALHGRPVHSTSGTVAGRGGSASPRARHQGLQNCVQWLHGSDGEAVSQRGRPIALGVSVAVRVVVAYLIAEDHRPARTALGLVRTSMQDCPPVCS